jgi:hypothetical protein
MTRYLLKRKFTRCGLLTERSKPGVIRIFELAGYKKVYDWINVYANLNCRQEGDDKTKS